MTVYEVYTTIEESQYWNIYWKQMKVKETNVETVNNKNVLRISTFLFKHLMCNVSLLQPSWMSDQM